MHAIYRIKSLVEEQPQRASGINPRRTILIKRRIVPEYSEEIKYHEEEARQGDLPPYDEVLGLLCCFVGEVSLF